MHHDIVALADHLRIEQITLVVMEAAGDYWKPFYCGLEERLNVMLVNARYAKTLPGRETDVSDAQWLAELVAIEHSPIIAIWHILSPTPSNTTPTARTLTCDETTRRYSPSSGIRPRPLTTASSRQQQGSLVVT